MARVETIIIDREKLDALRRSKFLLKQQLGRQANLSESTMRLAYAGHPISLSSAQAIATALGVSVASIVNMESAQFGVEKAKMAV